MIIKEIIQKLRTTMDDARGQESHFESWLTQNEGICDAIDALKKLDNSEPVAIADGSFNCNAPLGTPLYTAPQPAQKPWVGLTHKEKIECSNFDGRWDCVEATEDKLKEKNT